MKFLTRRLGLLVITLCLGFISFSQKQPIQLDSYKTWSEAQASHISSDGKYIMFTIDNKPAGSNTLVIQDTINNWKREFVGGSFLNTPFLHDGSCIVSTGDSLQLLNPGHDQTEYLSGISNFKISDQNDHTWLAYQTKDSGNQLILYNLRTKSSCSLSGIVKFEFTPDGEGVLLQREFHDRDHPEITLQWLTLGNGVIDSINIWKGAKVAGYTFDKSGKQLAFIGYLIGEKESDRGLWYFRKSMDSSILLVKSGDRRLASENELNEYQIHFNDQGDHVFFNVEPIVVKPDQNNAKVDIWSYTDAKLQSQQLTESGNPGQYVYSYNLANHSVAQISNKNETVLTDLRTDNGGWAIVIEWRGDYNEWYWNTTARSPVYLVSTKDGSRKLLNPKANFNYFELSPTGRYVIYYDSEDHNYYSYETATGIDRNITKGIPAVWTSPYEWAHDEYFPLFQLNWTDQDRSIIIADQFDLWQINPATGQDPINLTNGLGKRNNIEFRISRNLFEKRSKDDKIVFLQAFNKTTKESGFFSAFLGKQSDPEKLTMGPYLFGSDITQSQPSKENKGLTSYLLSRRSAKDAPNFYITSDLEHFKQVTHIEPQKGYNWLTSELVTWKSLDGGDSQGVLFKPENFDPAHKYPVIFFFYERLSDKLNDFLDPKSNGYSINIPYLVSNGYLVFEPDIHYKTGYPGRSAYNYIVSAAKYLSALPWVDSTKMGLDGHSFGGFEVNYVVTHSHLFAAAVSASGMSDFISAYGSIIGDGTSRQRQYEAFRDRIGATLWQRPDLYIENSPILKADKIITPLLLMNNKADADVPFAQGVELFTALRRLKKPVWMLQYDNEGHQLSNGRNVDDFSLRIVQFFDHFLRGQPAPVWLSIGVPARSKGIDSGLEFIK
jgi:hypothetical protein